MLFFNTVKYLIFLTMVFGAIQSYAEETITPTRTATDWVYETKNNIVTLAPGQEAPPSF